MQAITVLFDARPLQPETRHWGPGVFVENILRRLSSQFHFRGLAHRFPANGHFEIVTWPRIPKTGQAFFEISPLLGGRFEIYWGTNHFLPRFVFRPSVVTVHDSLIVNNLDREPRQRLRIASFQSSLRRARRIATVSRTTADDLLRIFPALRGKLEVIPNGFDRPNGDMICNCSAANQSGLPYVVMLGAHRPRKNLTLAVAAVRHAREAGTPMCLYITGNIHPCFRSILAESGEMIKPVGVLPKQEVMCILRNAHALLFPSLYEGFGFPILEAMAVRCPVIALDTPINREVAGTAAWLLPHDVERWADALRTLSINLSLREELADKGMENVKRFSWDAAALAYGQVFSEVCR
jgi:glycosyltransferase involved in cell wall biosynthesis